MTEPTYKQHLLLVHVRNNQPCLKHSNDSDMEQIWELVRAGYLKSLVSFVADWSIKITEQGEKYLDEIKEGNFNGESA